ncbi:MAG: FAD-dependent oxidoreductase [Erysipelotrichaceae bacterium]|nr:FAD-dependent oxidoreductase [Erysipelotrichaceae bacterium]
MKFPHLFTPLKIGNTTVKNRIFMSPMTTNLCDTNNRVTEEAIAFYEARARGGAGLITIEGAMVTEKSHYRGLTNLGLYDDSQIPMVAKLADTIHRYDCRAVVQLLHGGPACLPKDNGGMIPWAASPIAIRTGWLAGIVPNEMPIDVVKTTIHEFAQAAERAKKAGLDGVEIHACHRHGLIGSFLSQLSNKRVDEYGGNVDGRLRFLLEVIREARELCGEDFLIFVRLSLEELEYGGQSLIEGMHIAQEVERAGANFIHFSRGTTETFWITTPPSGSPKALHSQLAREMRQALNIPYGVVGRISEPWVGELVLEQKRADAVYIGRALLCDPEFPNKAREGKTEAIRYCIGCTDCIGRVTGPVIHCAINPESARETVKLQKTGKPKKVLVVGGGPGGLHAATVLAKRGHTVTLAEKNRHPGGNMQTAGVPNGKEDLLLGVRSLIYAAKEAGVDIQCDTTVDREYLEKNKFDEVVLASGALPLMPAFLAGHAVSGIDVLNGKVSTGRNIVVVGGGSVGCETADFLIHPRNDYNANGKKVTVLELTGNVASDDRSYQRTRLMERLIEKGCRILTNAEVIEVEENSVTYRKDGMLQTLENVDTIVAAVGLRSDTSLKETLEELKIPYHIIGDAVKPRRITDAVSEAQLVAESI